MASSASAPAPDGAAPPTAPDTPSMSILQPTLGTLAALEAQIVDALPPPQLDSQPTASAPVMTKLKPLALVPGTAPGEAMTMLESAEMADKQKMAPKTEGTAMPKTQEARVEASANTAADAPALLTMPRAPVNAAVIDAVLSQMENLGGGAAASPKISAPAIAAGAGGGAGAGAGGETAEAVLAAQSSDEDDEPDDDAASVGTHTSVVEDIAKTAGVSVTSSTLVWYFVRRNNGPISRFLEVASRPLSILRPGIDILCLPLGFPVLADLWKWAVANYGYELWQAMWYPVNKLENPKEPETGEKFIESSACYEPICSSVASLFKDRLDSVLMVPFQTPKALTQMLQKYKLRAFGDAFDGLAIKDCLHGRPIEGAATKPHQLLLHPETGVATTVHVPRGFTCDNPKELREGFDALKTDGVEKVVLKPSWTSSGHGIEMDVSRERVFEYEWDSTKGSIVLEELLEVDTDGGKAMWPVVHFLAKTRCGDVVEQLIAGTTSYNGTVSPAKLTKSTKEVVEEAAMAVADVFDFSGFWGIDILMCKGVPYLIDVNSGRPNGGHVPKIFVSMHAPGQPFKFWKAHGLGPKATAASVHAKLVEHKLAFSQQTRRGIIILHVFPGVIATFMAIARTKKGLAKLLTRWDKAQDSILFMTDGVTTASTSARAPIDPADAQVAAATA